MNAAKPSQVNKKPCQKSPLSNTALVIATALLSLVSSLSMAAPAAAESNLKFPFSGNEYLHRWSQKNQNEFTPLDQPNLNTWKDMMTINLYPGVKTGEALSAVANLVVVKYQEHGKILRTDSKERTATKPAEHIVAALLGDPKFLEAVFARFVLVNDSGYAIIYSHRVYGEKAGPEMSKWLKENGAETEQRLMSFDKIPTPKTLTELPQSK
ncbi:MAG: hypothetical protein QG574_497 [Cyanobacteriota bacterium erpe_2018_sw_21hr_WHONDRS-SW48-000092_B_bin.40]|nr:hypothetical protein [Cyanobacteriota bacterium erpe_2018_sw_21hr_WHONDRS-SW48-000092_B_bin.40]